MENIFITKLTLEKVRNLGYIEIPLAKDKKKHLILTGKNGSGKTTILNGLSEVFDTLTTTNRLSFAESQLTIAKNALLTVQRNSMDQQKTADRKTAVDKIERDIEEIKKGFAIELNCTKKRIRYAFEEGSLVIAYYKAERTFEAEIAQHVEKVTLQQNYKINDSPRKDFVKYLLDLKMTQALAVSGNKKEKADGIQEWFDKFERLMQEIFENDQLKLDFDEETFCFYIREPGKEPYDFNTLSSGYAAILDIVVDLMIRMERQTERKFRYDVPGIVFIDEIETHLHLALQKKILKLLTTMFPNIQFIVTTHSPFVLNSLDDVVIYDLEQNLLVENGLTDVPYDGIVEGYFNADILSDKLKDKFERYQVLVKKETLTDEDFEEIADLEMFLDEVPDYLALGITTEYQRLKLELSKREDIDG